MDYKTIALNIREFVPKLSMIVIKQRINMRYKQILKMRDWEYLNDDFVFSTSSEKSSGTSCRVVYTGKRVTVSSGSGAITPSHVGWRIRFGSEDQSYEISGVTCTSGTTFSLLDSYSGTTAGLSGSSFVLFQDTYTLSPSGVSVREVTGIVLQSPLREVSRGWIDRNDPEHTSTGTPEKYNVATQTKFHGNVKIHLWPSTDNSIHTLRVYFKKSTAMLSADTDKPLCSEELLEAWTLHDCYKMLSPGNANYIGLMRDQGKEYQAYLHEEIHRDLETASLPGRVRDTAGPDYIDDNYGSEHDVGYATGELDI